MGIFHVDCEVESILPAPQKVTVRKLLVDAGSELTWIPEAELRKIGLQIVKKDCPFQMANGQTITRSIGYALLRSGGFETVDEVVFGQPGDLALLGSRTLRRLWRCCGSAKEKTGDRWPLPRGLFTWPLSKSEVRSSRRRRRERRFIKSRGSR